MVLGEQAVSTLPRSPVQQPEASVDPGDSTSATPKRNKSYRGYLHKRSSGAIKRWQKRYFTLEQRRLHYYNGACTQLRAHIERLEVEAAAQVEAQRAAAQREEAL